MNRAVIAGARLFDGDAFYEDHALVIADGKVEGILPRSAIADRNDVTWLSEGVLTPGFVDAQVNGGGGRMLNDDPSPGTMAAISTAHRAFGTTALLPTLISDTREKTAAAIAGAIAARDIVEGVAGLHLEGPHLTPAKRGAHLAQFMRPMDKSDVDALVRAASELRVLHLTVAAEQVTAAQVRRLAAGGVVVSLGHTDCTSDQADALFDAGARGATHLFNAMSGLSHRSPGLVGATLDRGDVYAGVIADGFHVDALALRIALRAKRGPGRLFHVTDAMALVGDAATSFSLNGRTVRRDSGGFRKKRLALEDGTLAGSDLDMASAVRFGVETLDLPLQESLRMATSYPARFLRIDDDYGTFRPGARADCVHLGDRMEVLDVWLGGRRQRKRGQEW